MNKSYVINTNITLNHIPMDKIKTTSIGVYIHRKLNKADASANALLPYVLTRGSELAKSTSEIAKYLENLYGASFSSGVMKIGEDQVISFDAETISDRFATNGETLLADLTKLVLSIVFAPVTENNAFKEEYVEQEKKNAIDRIKSVINNKRAYAQKRCIEIMCEGEAFAESKIGTIEGIEAINAENLYDYYKKLITESAIDIFVCGEADIEEISNEIRKYQFDFKKGEIPRAEIKKGSNEVKNVSESMDVTQGKLSMGFVTNTHVTHDDFDALMVANSIFGSGAHSKLFNNVREKLSLCYYASSSLVGSKGMMLVNAGIEFENFQKAYDEILVQLDAVKKGDISDFEFEASVNALENSYKSSYDDPTSMQNFYLSEIIAGTDNSPEEYIERLKKVTKEDVIKVMNKVELDTVYFLKGKGGEI